jgi:hypothetical protein
VPAAEGSQEQQLGDSDVLRLVVDASTGGLPRPGRSASPCTRP